MNGVRIAVQSSVLSFVLLGGAFNAIRAQSTYSLDFDEHFFNGLLYPPIYGHAE